MKKETINRSVLIVLAVLLFFTTWIAGALPANHDAIPPAIEPLYTVGSYSRAAEELQAAVGRTPKDASLYYWLGRCYFEVRDFDRSISSWKSAIGLDSARSEYHDWLGRAYGRKAEEDAHSKMASALSLARRTHHQFEIAVQLDAKNISAQRDLTAFMSSAPSNLGGGEKHALEQIRALSAVDSLEGMLAMAVLYAAPKKFEQAGDEYQEILKSAPNRIDAHLEAADFYRDRDEGEHMEQAVEAAVRVNPSDRRINYYRGVAPVLQKKDSETAEKDLRAYIDTVPDSFDVPGPSSAYEYLGRLYESEGRPDAAQRNECFAAVVPRGSLGAPHNGEGTV